MVQIRLCGQGGRGSTGDNRGAGKNSRRKASEAQLACQPLLVGHRIVTCSSIRLGAGAGFAGDWIEPAVELVENAALDYLVFECLAERTIALAQTARQDDNESGYDPRLAERLKAVLPGACRQGTGIITNMGAANPRGAAVKAVETATALGLRGLRVAAVMGDDVLDKILTTNPTLTDRPGRVSDLGDKIISANAYLGAAPVVEALAGGAHIIITGRICDAALFLAPLIHRFGWSWDDWTRLGRGTVIGHLLECAGQLSGGYFADPGLKDVAGLARIGFPYADVFADGNGVLGKVENSGGRLDIASCTEQLLYEVFDPSDYLQADVTADFSGVRFGVLGPDRIAVSGGSGHARPDSVKVSIGYNDGFIGEGQISYAGPGAVARGRLALEIVRERLWLTKLPVEELDFSLIGIDAVDKRHPSPDLENHIQEVRLRVAGRTASSEMAARIGMAVEGLYTNGPAGGGGVSINVRRITAVASALLPQNMIRSSIVIAES